jgi:paraquat-inducible protein B
MTDQDGSNDSIPVATVRHRRLSLAWLLPIAALVAIAGAVVYQLNQQRGPVITITFTQAEGLEPGAEIVHRGIAVGVVRAVGLTPDLAAVRVTAELNPAARGLAREGTAFWVVRPEVSLSRVAGLETILGPRYIAARPGPPDAALTLAFEGLDEPPATAEPEGGGLAIELIAPRASGLVAGTPVTFRGVRVGVVRGVTLAEDARTVVVSARIDEACTHLVRTNSRFWFSAGVGVDFGLFSGLSVRAESIESLVRGAVAFATPDRPGDPVRTGHRFELADEPEDRWLGWDPALPPAP